MPPSNNQYQCQECESLFPVWQGKCTNCNAWNSLLEYQETKRHKGKKGKKKSQLYVLNQVKTQPQNIISSQISELDQTVGHGFVKGSVTLLSGEPGIGKSTLSLQIAQNFAKQGFKTLYISAEESLNQLLLRSKRLGKNEDQLLVLSETNMATISEILRQAKPEIVILDSIQVVNHPEISGIDGSISQVRYCSSELINWIKESESIGIIIGHITKEGNLAGPKVLEHMVDMILYFEGERSHRHRILRCLKNRFATTEEIGIFEMTSSGLREVAQPAELFIDKKERPHSGSIIAPICEGNRVILVEIQALVVNSGYGMAKRNIVGVGSHRANLMIAAMEKIMGVKLSARDIFLTIIGGIKVTEPAIDLAVITAIMSSVQERPFRVDMGVIGEVALTGEVRAVPNIDRRINELQKLGFKGCFLPEKSRNIIKETPGFNYCYISNLSEMIDYSSNKNEEVENIRNY